MKVKVRKLQSSDFHTILGIAGKMSNDAMMTLLQQKEVSKISMGLAFLSAALNSANVEIKDLMCSLTELKMEEYDKQSFDFPARVLEEVFKQEDIGEVFLLVRDLFKGIITKSSTN